MELLVECLGGFVPWSTRDPLEGQLWWRRCPHKCSTTPQCQLELSRPVSRESKESVSFYQLGSYLNTYKKGKNFKKPKTSRKNLNPKVSSCLQKLEKKIPKFRGKTQASGGFHRIWLEIPWFPDQDSESVSESESSSRYVQCRKRTRNRVLDLNSLIPGIETWLHYWTMEGIGTAEPGSEKKISEPGISDC